MKDLIDLTGNPFYDEVKAVVDNYMSYYNNERYFVQSKLNIGRIEQKMKVVCSPLLDLQSGDVAYVLQFAPRFLGESLKGFYRCVVGALSRHLLERDTL